MGPVVPFLDACRMSMDRGAVFRMENCMVEFDILPVTVIAVNGVGIKHIRNDVLRYVTVSYFLPFRYDFDWVLLHHGNTKHIFFFSFVSVAFLAAII